MQLENLESFTSEFNEVRVRHDYYRYKVEEIRIKVRAQVGVSAEGGVESSNLEPLRMDRDEDWDTAQLETRTCFLHRARVDFWLFRESRAVALRMRYGRRGGSAAIRSWLDVGVIDDFDDVHTDSLGIGLRVLKRARMCIRPERHFVERKLSIKSSCGSVQ